MFDLINTNWVAVIGATLAYFILGAVWFTPLFGKLYDKGTGVARSSKQKWPAIYYYGPFLSSLIVTICLALLINALDVQSIVDGIILGIIVGLALGSISVSNAIAPNMPRPLLYGFVVGSYHLAGSGIVAVILVSFK